MFVLIALHSYRHAFHVNPADRIAPLTAQLSESVSSLKIALALLFDLVALSAV